MSPWLKRLISATRSSRLWIKALDAASKANYENASKNLASIYRIREGNYTPSDEVTPEINILAALVEYRLGNSEFSISFARKAIKQLDRESRSYSQADRDYLKYYCRIMLEAISMRSGFEVFQLSREIKVSYSHLDFALVKAVIKRNFPIAGPVAFEIAAARQ